MKVTALLTLAILASACVRLISISPAPDGGSSVDDGSLRQDGIPLHDGKAPKADGDDATNHDLANDLTPAHDHPQVTNDLTPALDHPVDHPQVTNDLTPAFDHPQADKGSAPAAWLANARLRREIKIVSSNSQALTSFQVLIHLDSQALIQRKVLSSDCKDLAFTDSDGTTVLPYWIEGGCNSTDTRIWVKIPKIATQSSRAYVYYHFVSTLPSNGSNGSAVFLFFDDFAKGLGQWTGFGNPLPKAVAEASCHDGWAYTTNGDLNYTSGSFSKPLLDLTHGVVVEARIRQLAGAGPWDMLYGFALGSATSGYTDRSVPLLASVRINGKRPDAHADQTDDVIFSTPGKSIRDPGSNDHHYHRYRIRCTASGKFEISRDDLVACANLPSVLPITAVPIVLHGRDYSHGQRVDWVFGRKHAAHDPTTSLGPEERTP